MNREISTTITVGVEEKKRKVDKAWMWFTRLNIIVLLAITYLLYAWMQENPTFTEIDLFFHLMVIISVLAILFIIHYTSVFSFILGIAILINTLLSPTKLFELQVIGMIVIELGMGIIAAPLVYFHLKYLIPEEKEQKNTSPSNESQNSGDESESIKATSHDKLEELLGGLKTLELVIFSVLGITMGVLFYFTFSSYLKPFRRQIQGIIALVIVGIIIVGVILAVGYPLTIATRYVPEVILRKIVKKELPFDLRILLGSFLLLGTTVFFASLVGVLASPKSLSASLDLINTNWVLILILMWGLMFHGGTIAS